MMEKDRRQIEALDERNMAKAERSIKKLRPLRDAPLAAILPIPSCCQSRSKQTELHEEQEDPLITSEKEKEDQTGQVEAQLRNIGIDFAATTANLIAANARTTSENIIHKNSLLGKYQEAAEALKREKPNTWTYSELCYVLDRTYNQWQSGDGSEENMANRRRTNHSRNFSSASHDTVETADPTEPHESQYDSIVRKHNGKPFLEFGCAIENFFNLERSLIRLFLALSAIALVQMGIFWSIYEYNKFEKSSLLSFLQFSSFG